MASYKITSNENRESTPELRVLSYDNDAFQSIKLTTGESTPAHNRHPNLSLSLFPLPFLLIFAISLKDLNR